MPEDFTENILQFDYCHKQSYDIFLQLSAFAKHQKILPYTVYIYSAQGDREVKKEESEGERRGRVRGQGGYEEREVRE